MKYILIVQRRGWIILVFISFIVLKSSVLPSNAEMYQWTDPDGIVHYSDAPHPENADADDFHAITAVMPDPGDEVNSPGKQRIAPVAVGVKGTTRTNVIVVPPSSADLQKQTMRCSDQFDRAMERYEAAGMAENNSDYMKAEETYFSAERIFKELSGGSNCDNSGLAETMAADCRDKGSKCIRFMNDSASGDVTAKWYAMIGCLKNKDAKGALEYIHPKKRHVYNRVFTLIDPRLEEMCATFSEFRFEKAYFNRTYGEAQGEIICLENGKKYSYPADFEMDEQGEWWICSF